MAATKTKESTRHQHGARVQTANGPVTSPEVLTLNEAAAYLRIAEAEVLRVLEEQNLPGRLIGQEWRFLKSALQDWLRMPAVRPSKEAVLARIGSWQNDPYLEQELDEIHKRRGRPMGAGDK